MIPGRGGHTLFQGGQKEVNLVRNRKKGCRGENRIDGETAEAVFLHLKKDGAHTCSRVKRSGEEGSAV